MGEKDYQESAQPKSSNKETWWWGRYPKSKAKAKHGRPKVSLVLTRYPPMRDFGDDDIAVERNVQQLKELDKDKPRKEIVVSLSCQTYSACRTISRRSTWSMWGQWRANVRVQYRWPEAKTTEVEACMALVCASTDDGRPLTDWVASQVKFQVAGHAYRRHS